MEQEYMPKIYPESDLELVRKFFAIQDSVTLAIAERTYSDSKLKAVREGDPKLFSQWVDEAKAWRQQTEQSIQ